MSANVKKVSVMGSDDVTDDVTDDDDGDRQEEDQEADRKSIDIPGDMQEMAEVICDVSELFASIIFPSNIILPLVNFTPCVQFV